jgi:hypothetical protein
MMMSMMRRKLSSKSSQVKVVTVLSVSSPRGLSQTLVLFSSSVSFLFSRECTGETYTVPLVEPLLLLYQKREIERRKVGLEVGQVGLSWGRRTLAGRKKGENNLCVRWCRKGAGR